MSVDLTDMQSTNGLSGADQSYIQWKKYSQDLLYCNQFMKNKPNTEDISFKARV